MSNDGKKVILSAALMHGLGMHLGAWMARDGAASDWDWPFMLVPPARNVACRPVRRQYARITRTSSTVRGRTTTCGRYR